MANTKRKEIEDLIIKTMSILDSTEYNANKYKDLFKGMSDKEFDEHMKKFLNDEEENFYLEVVPFAPDTLSLESVKQAADFLDIPLNEYIYMPYANPEGEPLRSQYPVPVGYLHLKRMQQILSKKNSFTTNIEHRSAKLGQVVSDDKAGIISDNDNFSLVTIGAENALKEFLSARADDMNMKSDMYRLIERDGYFKLADLHSDVNNKQAINTLDVYFVGSGIKTDLITSSLILSKTLDNKDMKTSLKDTYKNK